MTGLAGPAWQDRVEACELRSWGFRWSCPFAWPFAIPLLLWLYCFVSLVPL